MRTAAPCFDYFDYFEDYFEVSEVLFGGQAKCGLTQKSVQNVVTFRLTASVLRPLPLCGAIV